MSIEEYSFRDWLNVNCKHIDNGWYKYNNSMVHYKKLFKIFKDI